MRDERTVSFGIERALGRDRRSSWGNRPVRLGVTARRWAYELGGAPLDEWIYSAGTGFEFQGGRGQLDLALSYGTIGDRSQNGYATEYWRLTVSVSGFERWW
jgi:hypothetical protein